MENQKLLTLKEVASLLDIPERTVGKKTKRNGRILRYFVADFGKMEYSTFSLRAFLNL